MRTDIDGSVVEVMDESTAEARDRGEPVSGMQPLTLSESSRHRSSLTDLVVELTARSAGLSRSLPTGVATALAELVRGMNCYYSNLIEGHDTHPFDIERALRDDYSDDPRTRDLQLEARAHIAVQRWIDEGGIVGRATDASVIVEMHRRFCDLLPPDMLLVHDPDTGHEARVIPGRYRGHDVRVGRHVPISSGAVPRFLAEYEATYARLGRSGLILSAAAAHHRLLWIHPFLDGNGRVARLVSYAMLREPLETGGVWSIARGLARNEARYKQHLASCDLRRRNDLDGRGALSEECLVDFTRFFLETCLDQVVFMERLVEPLRLRARILGWASEEARSGMLPDRAAPILETLLYRGEIPRSEVSSLLGVTDRQARRVTGKLLDRDIIASDGPRASLRLNFPAALTGHWMPGLFPDRRA